MKIRLSGRCLHAFRSLELIPVRSMSGLSVSAGEGGRSAPVSLGRDPGRTERWVFRWEEGGESRSVRSWNALRVAEELLDLRPGESVSVEFATESER